MGGSMSIVLQTPSNGSVTLAEQDTASNLTITIPAVNGTINTSGAINTVPAGTAAAPAITTTGDTNTGIFFPAADTIAFSEGGAESMRIDSGGNLLIATTSVSRSSKVTINGTMAVPQINFGATTSNVFLYEGATNEFTVRTGASGVEKFFGFGINGRFSALSGPCAGVGAYIDLSDVASKTNIVAAPYGLADVLKLNTVMLFTTKPLDEAKAGA